MGKNYFKTTLLLQIVLFVLQCSSSLSSQKPIIDSQTCVPIPTAMGPEDMEILTIGEKTYLIYSSHNRRNPESIGGLYSIFLDLKSLKTGNFISHKIPVISEPSNFRPHGITLAPFQGKQRLYAISHPIFGKNKPPHTIEVFEVEDKKDSVIPILKHKETLTHPLLTSPNDLFALPEEKLYISNDPGQNITLTNAITIVFGLSDSTLVYYEKGKFYNLNQDIPFGNGIWIDTNKNELYRSSHSQKKVYVYHWETKDSELPTIQLKTKISFPGGPDNLYKNKYGLYTTTHNSNWKFLQHSKDTLKTSPSEVWEIKENNDIKLIFSDDGKKISAASSALVYKNWLFIGQVFEPFILACPWEENLIQK